MSSVIIAVPSEFIRKKGDYVEIPKMELHVDSVYGDYSSLTWKEFLRKNVYSHCREPDGEILELKNKKKKG